jgi:hypothetical protein
MLLPKELRSSSRKPGTVRVKKLFYVSRVASPLSVAALRRLLGAAQVANRRSDITGILVYTGQYFAQILEGPDAGVTALAARIRGDLRHSDFRIVREEEAAARDFPTWSMELFESPQLELELEGLLAQRDGPAVDPSDAALSRIKREARWRAVSLASEGPGAGLLSDAQHPPADPQA